MNNTPEHGFNLTITMAMAVAGLASIVKRFGADHLALNPDGSAGCTYFVIENGVLRPICIVGQFFADLGILRVLMGPGGNTASCTITNVSNLGHLLEPFGIYIDVDAREFLQSAQTGQDERKPWGEAVENAAREVLEERGEPTTSLALLLLHEEVATSPSGGLS